MDQQKFNLAEAQAVLREYGFRDYPTPWIHETALAVKDRGAWADYYGWHRWFSREMESLHDDAAVWWDTQDALDDTWLYVEMSSACLTVAEMMGWKEAPIKD